MVNIESKINTYWPELQKEFPGFEKPQVVPGDAIRREARIHHLAYMVEQIDQDPTALYIFIKGNPKNGPCDRDTAVDFYYNLMSVKGSKIPLSFEDEFGVDPHTAADLEVLPRPADKRQQYANNDIFGEFMRQFKAEMEKAQREADDRKFKEKFGFDRNDPDIIDVYPDGEEPAEQTNAVEKAVGTEVGTPRPIMYCVVLHPGFGTHELGFDGGRRVGRRGNDYRRLREEDDMIREALGDDYEMDEEDFNEMTDQALQDECDMCGDNNCKDGEICGLKEAEDDLQETEDEINEIIGDEMSDTEKTIDEYERIEDDIEEDDDMLSESVIRHATMLAREIW